MYLELYDFVAKNREVLRLLYSLLIVIICFTIVMKTNRIFKISLHNGIRYFRNAFLFYGIAFSIRYFLSAPNYFYMIRPVFEFFMVMGGFFLFYSLIWKKFENKNDVSSLYNSGVMVFYLFSIIIATLDTLWGNYNFMYVSQIVIFLIASVISYQNYRDSKKGQGFLKLYFVVMILSLIAWTLNFVFDTFLGVRLRFLANVYGLNIIVFLVFLFGVLKFTKKRRG